MASKFIKSAKRSLDLPVAGLAALSAGFVIFSLPPDLLESLVGATGIAGFVAAAQPPLGQTARIALSLAAAFGAFGMVYFLLRLIDRRPAEREPEEAEEEAPPPRRRRIVEEAERQPEAPAIRLRRWDTHPDAPARRPIFAVSDIGEPEPPRSPLAAKPKKAEAPAAPFWQPDDFPAADPEEAESWMEQQEQTREEPPLEPATPVPAPEPEHVNAPEALPEPQPVAEQPSVVQPPVLPPPLGNESIAELMARLERGLSRRQEKAPEEAPSPADPQPVAAFSAPADDRLRSAIQSLQRIAARGV